MSPLAGWRRKRMATAVQTAALRMPQCVRVHERISGTGWEGGQQLASVASGAISRKGSISDMDGALPFLCPGDHTRQAVYQQL